MNTPQNTTTDNGLAGIPCVEHGTECDGSTNFCEPVGHPIAAADWTAPNAAAVSDSRDRAARNRALNNSAAMCPMHCGNPAATCKARGRCVYVVTNRNAAGR